jgi:predicted molibdopterin-dependent oxidoreductase YjgC
MEIQTRNEDVERGRRTILELLNSTIGLEEAPEILDMMADYGADDGRFAEGKRRESPIYDDNPFYIRDYNQCINCWRCVQVCAEDAQYTFALSFDGRGFETKIGTFLGNGMMDTTCVFCGQCVGACPTGALKPKRQALLESGVDPDDIFSQTRGGRKKKS